MTRTELREHIMKMGFCGEFYPLADMEQQLALYFQNHPEIREKDQEYIRMKWKKMAERTEQIDAFINRHTTGWKTSRMNKVDLAILRVAVYEMKWDEDIPIGVAINEAVELAKKYSGDGGPSFVNGVLAKLIEAPVEEQSEEDSEKIENQSAPEQQPEPEADDSKEEASTEELHE